MLNWRNTRITKLEGEDRSTSAFEMVINRTYELGFHQCWFKMSSNQPGNPVKPIEFTNYPAEWKKVYDEGKFFEVDPVVKRCKESVLPVLWEEEIYKDVPSLWSLARTLGVHRAVTLTVHDFRGVFSMLILSRDKDEISPVELYEKAGLGMWLCHAMHTVLAPAYADKTTPQPTCKLTRREIDILMWSAMGKTAEEIAAILSISTRTVGFHISSVLKKLGVNNKIAAVLYASKMGLF